MRKPDFLPVQKQRDIDQLCNICTSDQRLCLLYMDSTLSSTYTQNFKLLAFFVECTGQFVSDLVRILEDQLIDALRPSQQQWSCWDVASILWDFYPTFRMP